jgi:hypothetical protein
MNKLKPLMIGVAITIVCGMENFGHYFGICFHGILYQAISGLTILLFSLGMYGKQVKDWLNNCYAKPDHKCKCKENHSSCN